ncbi:MAG: monosaccharide transporter substrate-binding protein family [Pseudonocardia sp.]|uniref:substrate-binding domain-containing protein n=1 Tax=Pseudonocardia sp. TaxID=60912 RepID=UPI002618C612|nr:substrate-binding domain-containing protein [Pseudonocardia sp.]MCU1628925.1 monosaccharide transporter substrate-binding protein family [Pseudonocardia sp.]MDT7703288.1 ribose transport system substrate-binding protein [Pseudonocardiales bacterium]
MSGRVRGRAVAVAAALLVALAGCASTGTAAPPQRGYPPAQQALTALAGTVLATGPNGETPARADSVSLTPAEIEQVRAKKATAAIVMHYTGDGWTDAQIAGLRQQFDELGIEVVAVTDANFEPDRQVSDIETVLARKPDIIVSIPADPVATAGAYKQAAAAGVKLVFMDNVPQGMVAGKDYVSAVSADNVGNGVVAAHLMADAIGGKGEIGVVFHEADFKVTRQRLEGFEQTIAKDYPDIRIVDRKGVTGPDFAGQAQAAATAMMVKHQELAGIWGVWDVPTEGVIAAARAIDRSDLAITTEDLGPNVAIALASNQYVTGLGAQRPFDQGLTEAKLAAYSLIGKQAPPYVALDALPVTHDNVLEAWREVYHSDPPAQVTESLRGGRS